MESETSRTYAHRPNRRSFFAALGLAALVALPGCLAAQPTPEPQTPMLSGTVAPVDPASQGPFHWRKFDGRKINVIVPEYPMFQVWQGLYLLTEQFEKETGIDVSLQTLSSDVYGTFINPNLALPKGQGAVDVFIDPLNNGGYTMFKSGLIHELDSLVKDPGLTEPGYDVADFFEQFLQNGKANGTLYSIPGLFEAYILIYNKALVKKHLAGKIPDTMDELIKAAMKVTEEGRAWNTYGAMMRGAYRSSNIDTVTGVVFNSYGSGKASLPYNMWFDGSWDNPQIVSPNITRGMDQYARLLRAGPINARAINWPQATAMFEQNRVMFFIDASQFEVYFEDPDTYVAGNTGYALLPPVEKGGTSYTGFWQLGFMIPNNVSDDALGPAWYYVQYMTNKRAEPTMGMFTVGPTRKSTWQNPQYVRTLDPEYYQVMLKALETARTTTVQNSDWDPMAKAIICGILHMKNGEPPEKASAEAQDTILKIVKKEPYNADCPRLPLDLKQLYLSR